MGNLAEKSLLISVVKKQFLGRGYYRNVSKEDISDEMNGTWESTEVELIQNHALRWELNRLICSREGNKFKWIEELQESQSYGTEELFSVDRELYHDENSLKISLQFSSVAQLCPTLCDPMNHSTPGLPVHHHLPEFAQTHVHRVGDATQPSHPLSSPSPPAPQHQSLFQWVNSSHEVAKVLEFQL